MLVNMTTINTDDASKSEKKDSDLKKFFFFFSIYKMTQAVAELSYFMHIYNYLAKTLHCSGCCDLHSPATIELMQGNFHCTAIPLPLHNKHCIALSSLAKMLLMSCHANHINQQLVGWLNMQN